MKTHATSRRRKQPREYVRERLGADAPAGDHTAMDHTSSVRRIELHRLDPTSLNPRFGVAEERVAELMASMAKPSIGQLQYPIARPSTGDRFELLTGRHRFEAAKRLGWESMLIDVRSLTEMEATEIATFDNMQRADLHPLEQAIGIDHMINAGWGLEGIAAGLGKSIAWVARRHSLVRLSARWQAVIRDPHQYDTPNPFGSRNYIGRLSAGHYERVARLPENVQEAKFDAIRQWFQGEMHDVELLDHRLHDGDRRLSSAKWSALDAEIVARLTDVGPCSTCPKQTAAAPLLFDDHVTRDKYARCLDGECWGRKDAAFVQIRIEDAHRTHGDELLCVETSYDSVPTALKRAVKSVIPGQPIVAPRDYQVASKTTRGARPAIAVNGENVGEVIYVKPIRPPAKVEPGQTRARLDQARWQCVFDRIQDQFVSLANQKATICEDRDRVLRIALALELIGDPAIEPRQFASILASVDAGKICAADRLLRSKLRNTRSIDLSVMAGEAVMTRLLELFDSFPGEWHLPTLMQQAREEFPDSQSAAPKPKNRSATARRKKED